MKDQQEPLKLASSNPINLTIPTAQSSKHTKNQQLIKSLFLTFHQAARDGQYAIVKEYLSSFGKDKKKINAKDEEQTSALHYAVRYGHFSVVKLLVENGANINIHDENGATPLHYASRHINRKSRNVDFRSDFKLPLEENHKHKWFHQPLLFSKSLNSNTNKLLYKAAKPNEIKKKKEPCKIEDAKKSDVFCSLISNVSQINFEIHNLNYLLNSPRILEARKSLGFTNQSHQLENETKKAVVIVGAVSQKEMKYMKNVDALILPPVKNVTSFDNSLKFSSLKDNLNEIDRKKSISIINNSVDFLEDKFKKILKDGKDQEDSMLVYLLERKANVNAKDFNDYTPLHYAVMRGNMFATKQLLLQKHIHIEATDQSEMTPLHCAALSGSYDACKLLLEHGANIFCQDKENMTPLHLAAMEGHIGIASLLFDIAGKKGDAALAKLIGSINRDKETALHLAVENNHIDIVELCIKKGFKVNSERENMISPLHLACTSGLIDIAKLLVENGANIESTNSLKETPLHRAAMFNRTDIIEYLLSEGASINCRDKDNETPLLMAVRKNNLESVKLLLQYSADITVKDANDKTCLFIAAEQNSKDVFEILCQNNIRSILEEFDKNEMTPLHIASKEGHESIVQDLLGLGACIDAKNGENLTPLHLAAKYGHARTVEILLSNVLRIVNDIDGSSNTPLHLAAMQGHVKVVEILIKSGADVEARNAGLWTPLDCAAFHGWVNCAQSLLDADSLVNPKDKDKVSSLQLACKEGHVDMVKLLLSKNADVSWKDHLGRNCLDYAIDNKQREAVIAIITSENWKVALRNSTFEGNKLTTPMRKLIKKLPDIAEQVFNQCITGNGLPIEHPQYKITCCYEFLEDLFTPWGPSVFKSKEYKNQYNRSFGLPADKETFGEKLRRKIKLFNFEVNTFELNHPLDFMVKNQRTKLLCHPLVTYLLRRKWSLCGRYVYYSRLLLYIIFLIFVTSYTLSIRADPHSIVCADENDLNVTKCYCQSLKSSVSKEVNFFISKGRYAILTLSTISLSIEFIKLLFEARHYFQLQRSIELSAYICSIIHASKSTSQIDDKSNLRCSEWYHSLGAATTTLCWLVLALFLRQFPKLGTYIFIFSHIMKTFAQFSVIFFLFMISFGLGLHLVMYKVIPYSMPSRSLAKMIVGMTGEFSFDSLYNNIENPKPLSMSWALFVLFIIVNCVIVMKLLVGLAIGEINDIKKEAVLNRLAMLVDLTLNVEKALPFKIQSKLVIMEECIFPNMKKASVLWSFWSFESPVTKVNKESGLKIVKKEHKKMKASVYKIRTAMKEMEAQNDRIENMLSVISKHLRVKI